MGSSASLGGASLSFVAAAALCGYRRGGTFATAVHYDVSHRNTRRLLRGRPIRKLQSDFDQTIPTMEQLETNADPADLQFDPDMTGIPGIPPDNMDMSEPPADPADPRFDPDMAGIPPDTDMLDPTLDPADLQVDPDMTGVTPGMDMLPPGSEGSSSEIEYVPSEEEMEMQEMLKLEAEQNEAMMPEGWDPNNPQAALDPSEEQNIVPSEEPESGAPMSEEDDETQGKAFMYDPKYDPSSPEFDEVALGELDEESLTALADIYGDEFRDKLPDFGLGEEPPENGSDSEESNIADFNIDDPKYDPSSPEFDEVALGELDEESLSALAEKYGDEIMETSPSAKPIEDPMDPANDPTLDTVISEGESKVTNTPPTVGFSDEYPQTPSPGDGEDPAEEPFDELEDPGEDINEGQVEEEYEGTVDMAATSTPPLVDMSTSATGLPPGAEIGQEPYMDLTSTTSPYGEVEEDEMNLSPEDEFGFGEDENDEWGLGDAEGEEDEWGLEDEWPLGPTDKPTPRPTALYVPFDESAEEGTSVEAGDEVFYHGLEPQIGPVGKYLDGVGSPEEIEKDKNVQVVGGVLLALFLVLILVTAHSVMNNPDGLCAG